MQKMSKKRTNEVPFNKKLTETFNELNIFHFGPPYPPNTVTKTNMVSTLSEWFKTFPTPIPSYNGNGNSEQSEILKSYKPIMGAEGYHNKLMCNEEIKMVAQKLQNLWEQEGGNVVTTLTPQGFTVVNSDANGNVLFVASVVSDKTSLIAFRSIIQTMN